MSLVKLIGAICAVVLIVRWQSAAPSAVATMAPKLLVREEPGRIVLAWNGPIAKPMRDDMAAAFDRFKGDPRRLIVSFNSPGGSVAEGRAVMAAILEVRHARRIDTQVEKGGVCASMCVPIYLAGAERQADPAAHFMFHQASLDLSALKDAGKIDDPALKAFGGLLANAATDVLFADDMGQQRVNTKWLAEMRIRIADHEVWLSGQQLVDEGSGVVDALMKVATN
jgi:ATP-dependent protease ClpP protease subunit